jgi:3D (Asp-Asp-Asp) domain-containing protein
VHARTRSPAAIVAAVAIAVSASAIPATVGAESRGPAADLRRHQLELERQSTSAVLELYALETQLATARSAAQEAVRRQQELEAEEARVAERLARVRRDAARAEALLASRLRTLYESSDVHPLAVVLGAASLDDALNELDGLRFVAEADRTLLAQTRAARRTLEATRHDLEARRSEAAAAAAAAVAHAAAAERARADTAAYLESLAREQRLTAARISELERQARAAREQAETLADAPAATASAAPAAVAIAAPPATSAPAVTQRAAGRTLTVVATAYALTGRTATGIPAGPGVVAVDPSVIPLGTKMTIPGYGDGIAADTGGSVKGNTIDLWFPSTAQALRWGRRTVTITLH